MPLPDLVSRSSPLPTVGHRLSADGDARVWKDFASPFYLRHLWMPLLAFAVLSTLLMGLHWDFWLADTWYAMEGHAWTLQSGYLTQQVVHAAGREASKIAWFAVALMLGASLLAPKAKQWRRPLAYLLLATLLSTIAVALLKRWTNMDCPWDLVRYGGHHAYYGLFTHRPSVLGHAQCFPAGHASAGYAWLGLFFFFKATSPRWRWWGLAFGMGAGLLFGIAQQLRGAHFLSHDLWALMICWLIALTLHQLMLSSRPMAPPAHAAT